MKVEALLRPLPLSLTVGLVALWAGAAAFAQQTIAFGGTDSSSGAAAIYTIGLGGSPLRFTSQTPTLVNSNPEPWLANTQLLPAVSALAFAPSMSNGNVDLVASNVNVGELYSLAGPSFAASTLLEGVQDCTAYPNSVGAESSGTIVSVGFYGCGTGTWLLTDTPATGWLRLDSLTSNWAVANTPDAVVASGNFGVAQTGDVFVLVGDAYGQSSSQPVVVRYPQSAIASGSCNNCGRVLLTQAGLPLSASVTPVSLDLSPIDGSLLIGTSDGSIWQLPFVSAVGDPSYYGAPVLYACLGKYAAGACVSSPGVSWGKIRTVQQSGQLYILATIPDASQGGPIGYVGLFASSGSLPIQGPVQTLAVQNFLPVGLAVPAYRTGTIPASTCFATAGNPLPNCDPLGDGVMKITIRGNTANIPPGATITEQECVVAADPRVVQYGTCAGHTLNLKDVCPGLSDSTVIPDYLCGAGGVSNPGSGFVIIAALAEQLAQYSDGIEVRTDSTSTPVLPVSPVCPQNVKLYGSNDHSQFETTFAEGHNAFETLGFCDPSGSIGPHHTINGIGLELDLTSFAPHGTPHQRAVKFADFKFGNLTTTIRQSKLRFSWEKAVLLVGTGIAKHLVDVGHYDCAAELVFRLDRFARRHTADFLPFSSATVREPNPFGDITGRLANLFLTIVSRIESKSVTWTDWPLAADPQLCRTTECNVSGMDN